MIAIVAAFALLVVVLVGQLTSRNAPGTESLPSASTSPAPRKSPAEGPFVKREPNDAKAMGDVDAPVVLVEWTDLRCPFCAAFSRDTLPAVIDEYVKAGKVRLEVHDVALFGSQSEEASVAAHAAAEQGRYFEYLHAVNAAAPEKGHPDLPRQELIAFARTAGVPDMEKFTTDLDSPKIRAAVQQGTADAQQLGINSVPFFVAGDMALSGAQPATVFRQYLDDALAKAK